MTKHEALGSPTLNENQELQIDEVSINKDFNFSNSELSPA
jgi:hypothetical protein